MIESQYDNLIGKIYDSVLMPELWPAFLEQLADVFHSRGTLLYLVDFSNRNSICQSDDLSIIHSVRMESKAVDEYERYYSKVNVWLEKSKDLSVGLPVTSDDLFSESKLIHTEWYNDWLKPHGYYRSLIGHVLKQENLTVRMTIFRDKQQEFSCAEINLFSRLVPHLQRFCLIYKKLTEFKMTQHVNAGIMNRLPIGVVLFDRYGQAVFVNDMAERLARSAQGFSLDAGGRCLTGNANQTRDLRYRIKTVIEQGRSQAMTLQRPCSTFPLSAVIVPLHHQALPFIGTGPSAALFICDPSIPCDLDESILINGYDLTPAEAKLATALLRGQSLSEYEKQRGISHNTVKTQLKQVMAKTGTHRQSELVQLLSTGFGLLATQHEMTTPNN